MIFRKKILLNLHPLIVGTLAQLVEQRTENPCVPGSIPGGTTEKSRVKARDFLFSIFLKFIYLFTSLAYAKFFIYHSMVSLCLVLSGIE